MDRSSYIDICKNWNKIFSDNSRRLVDMDNVVGDGDIGLVLSDGFEKVYNVICELEQNDIGKLVFQTGKILSKEAPSSMGTLLAVGFMRAGKKLNNKTDFSIWDIYTLLKELADGISETGGAKEGEKTILDSLYPGIRCLESNIESMNTCDVLNLAKNEAEKGFHNATNMIAKHGRIAFQGENSVGIEDPGAAVGVLLFEGICDALSEK